MTVQRGATAPRTKEQARDQLIAKHEAIRQAEAAEVRAVAVARALGVSWAQIGQEIGQQQPNATRKYKPLVERLIAEEGGVQVGTTTPDEALAAIRKAHAAIAEAEWQEVEAVADARTLEVPWGQIAEIVGMKQSNAIRKYKPFLAEERAVRVTAVRPAGERRRRTRN